MKRLGICILTSLVLLSGCSGTHSSEETKAVGVKKIKIGMIFDTFVVERWQRDRDKFVSTANELGAQVDVQNANGDASQQAKQIRYFIKNKVDVIVIVPIESKILIDPIKEARAEGIKVISYDRLINGGETDLYISFDNEEIGKLMGEAVSTMAGEGDKVLMVAGPQSDNNVAFVNAGFQSVMKEKNIKVTDITYIDEWKAENAASYIENNIQQVEQVKAIMCGNDNLAGQVIRVLAERRMAGNICVVGQDSDLEACQRIVEGTQYMTVYKPVELLAEYAAEAAVDLAKSKKLNTTDTISDGTYIIPYIKLTPLAVTEKNMNEIIIDTGFHLKEDIYINRPDKYK